MGVCVSSSDVDAMGPDVPQQNQSGATVCASIVPEGSPLVANSVQHRRSDASGESSGPTLGLPQVRSVVSIDSPAFMAVCNSQSSSITNESTRAERDGVIANVVKVARGGCSTVPWSSASGSRSGVGTTQSFPGNNSKVNPPVLGSSNISLNRSTAPEVDFPRLPPPPSLDRSNETSLCNFEKEDPTPGADDDIASPTACNPLLHHGERSRDEGSAEQVQPAAIPRGSLTPIGHFNADEEDDEPPVSTSPSTANLGPAVQPFLIRREGEVECAETTRHHGHTPARMQSLRVAQWMSVAGTSGSLSWTAPAVTQLPPTTGIPKALSGSSDRWNVLEELGIPRHRRPLPPRAESLSSSTDSHHHHHHHRRHEHPSVSFSNSVLVVDDSCVLESSNPTALAQLLQHSLVNSLHTTLVSDVESTNGGNDLSITNAVGTDGGLQSAPVMPHPPDRQPSPQSSSFSREHSLTCSVHSNDSFEQSGAQHCGSTPFPPPLSLDAEMNRPRTHPANGLSEPPTSTRTIPFPEELSIKDLKQDRLQSSVRMATFDSMLPPIAGLKDSPPLRLHSSGRSPPLHSPAPSGDVLESPMKTSQSTLNASNVLAELSELDLDKSARRSGLQVSGVREEPLDVDHPFHWYVAEAKTPKRAKTR